MPQTACFSVGLVLKLPTLPPNAVAVITAKSTFLYVNFIQNEKVLFLKCFLWSVGFFIAERPLRPVQELLLWDKDILSLVGNSLMTRKCVP